MKRSLHKILSMAGATLSVAALAISAPASATSAVGTWWTGHANCGNGIDLQVRYTNTSSGYTRADGFAINVTNNGYVRDVYLHQYMDNVQRGERDVYYNGSARSATMVDIPTTYLPWMWNGDYTGWALLDAYTSTGARCYKSFNIGH